MDDMTPMERVVVAEHERRQAVQRAEQAEAATDRVRAVWNEWRGRLGGAFPPAMVQEIDAALDHPTVCPHGKPTSADRPAIATTGVTLCTCCGDRFAGRLSGSDRCKTCRPPTTGETETR